MAEIKAAKEQQKRFASLSDKVFKEKQKRELLSSQSAPPPSIS
jgi:hypothetical protein